MLVLNHPSLLFVSAILLGCAPVSQSPSLEASPAINVGAGRRQFEDAVSRGLAFVVVGACDPRSAVESVEFESGSDLLVGSLGNRLTSLFAVSPNRFRLRRAIVGDAAVPVANTRALRLEPGTVTYIGAINEPSGGGADYVLGDCPFLFEALPKLFPYQIARLPFHEVRPG